MDSDLHSDFEIKRFYQLNIAVVGMSKSEETFLTLEVQIKGQTANCQCTAKN
jgi:hypothetical protein